VPEKRAIVVYPVYGIEVHIYAVEAVATLSNGVVW